MADLLEKVTRQAEEAFQRYRSTTGPERAKFLEAIAARLEDLGDTLVTTTMEETNLPEARLKGERARTTGQLRAFAKLLEKGEWVQASIDTADPNRTPAPKPDLRKMLFPIGPVVVFGASNFPYAFSTAGGDTASALAAGCSVLLKAHPGHPKTSALVARAVELAIKECGMPEHVFQHLEGLTNDAAQTLVQHREVKAVAFTGSYFAGRKLYDLAAKRPDPIPVFAEMGSVNPIVILPSALKRARDVATKVATSVTLGVGQFCTNPGLILVEQGENADQFLEQLAGVMAGTACAPMLHGGIAENYKKRKNAALREKGVTVLADVPGEEEFHGGAALASVTDSNFLASDVLHEEVFGPFSLVVQCADERAMVTVLNRLPGQLTGSLFGEEDEVVRYENVLRALQGKCGRLIINGVPTGVEVAKSTHHGGPFPATTDSRFTSVGVDAIYRFVRPVCFQDFPQALLPLELKNENSLEILRCVNGTFTTSAI